MQKGFTLLKFMLEFMLEFMLVIVIFGILVAVSITAFENKNHPKSFQNVPAQEHADDVYSQFGSMSGCKKTGENSTSFIIECPDGSTDMFDKK